MAESVDVTGIITNLQKLVLRLSNEHMLEKTTKSTERIRDMANFPDGTLSIRNSKFPVDHTAQLGDLQQQNVDLKAQYEDCVIALNSMMHVHRMEMTKFVNSKDTSGAEILLKQTSEKPERKIPLPVFQDLDDVFQASGINQAKLIEEIDRLKFENGLIRELIQMNDYSNIDVEALLERIENKTPLAKSPSSADSQVEAEEHKRVKKSPLESQITMKEHLGQSAAD